MKISASVLLKKASALSAIALFLLVVFPIHANLLNRYSFTSDASDSVGGANGTPNNITFSAGQAIFNGTNAYIQLPANLITNVTSVTFEAWETCNDAGLWERLFNFGNGSSAWSTMIMNDGVDGSFEGVMTVNGGPPSQNGQVVTGALLPSGVEEHVVFSVDAVAQTARLYVNGVQAGINTNFTLTPQTVGSTTNDWLGMSPFSGDPFFNGSIDEFRIYSGVVSPLQIAVDAAAGPNTIVTNSGTLQGLVLALGTTNMNQGASQSAMVIGNFANVTNVNLSGISTLTFTSSAPGIVAVTFRTTGWTLTAPGAGTATVTVSYQGQSASQVLTVNPGATQLIHRYSFTNDASDSIGGANGILNGGAAITGGTVTLDGISGYVKLPDNMLTNVTSVTFEAWETCNDTGLWERLFNFGNGSSPWSTMILKDGVDGSFEGAMTVNGGPPSQNGQVVTGALLPSGVEEHVVFSVDAVAQTARLYVNGVQAGINTNFTLTPQTVGPTTNDWLGMSPFSGDPFFNGSIDEFRIYSGVVSPLQIAVDAVTGPNMVVTNTGAIQSLLLTLGTTNMNQGTSQSAMVIGNFANVTNVNLSGISTLTFTSSAPGIVAVTFRATGWTLTAPGAGTATITVSYQGQSASQVLTVNPHPTTLIDRYSFTTDASDSVGGANGTIVGATITNGQVVFGAAGTYVSLPTSQLTNLTSVSFETWETDYGNDIWGRVFSFGNSVSPASWVDLIPHNGSDNLFEGAATKNGGPPNTQGQVVGTALQPTNVEQDVVFTINTVSQTATLYINGVQVAMNASFTLVPSDVWAQANANGGVAGYLGQSQYGEQFYGSIDELRIYNGALSPIQIAVDAATGPDNIATNPGTLQTLTLSVPTNHMNLNDTQNAFVTGHFSNVSSNVNLTTVATYLSSSTSVANVSTLGLVTAVGNGAATLSASLNGVTNSTLITVGTGAPPKLMISRSANSVILSWLDSAAGYELQSSASVGSLASWTPVSGTPTDSGGLFSQSVSVVGVTQYFRLYHP